MVPMPAARGASTREFLGVGQWALESDSHDSIEYVEGHRKSCLKVKGLDSGLAAK